MDAPASKVQDIFNKVVDLPTAKRGVFLERLCGGDAALRKEVESLLAAHEEAGQFLGAPDILPSAVGVAAPYAPGTRIGPYALLKVIGEGGTGTVYLAQQDAPLRRKVALKVIRPGMDTVHVLARFDLERQALALMDHPSIAKVLDAGSTEKGRPYFVMEFVDGLPITEFSRKEKLDLHARLRLFADVCSAIQHAHGKGIVHRDLKPGNVLVMLQDGKPAPKVIDFGIAKSLWPEESGGVAADITCQPQFLGTPQYMSPEQANLPRGGVDSRSDVYSLGAVLYELLADEPPFDPKQLRSAAYVEIHRILHEVEPVLPSERLAQSGEGISEEARTELRRRAGRVRGDLDWIVRRAMEKDAQRRYDTAQALAADIGRYLADEPVSAGPPGWWYRSSKFVRRHRVGIAMLAVVVLAVGVALAGVALWARSPAAPVLAPGLQADIFRDVGFLNKVTTRIDPQIDFAWPRGVPPVPGMTTPRYAIRWTGILKVPEKRTATLEMSWDDGVRVWVDGERDMGYRRPGEQNARGTLAAGTHRIVIEYWNERAGGRAQLIWKLSGGDSGGQIVPREALFHEVQRK